MNWAFSFGLLVFFLACAHQVSPSRDLAGLDKEQMMKIWKKTLKETHHPGKILSVDKLEQIYLSSVDEEDFFEHFLHVSPANSLVEKKDYLEFDQNLSHFQERLKVKSLDKKAQGVYKIVSDLKEVLKDAHH
jgi:hypothetical protein